MLLRKLGPRFRYEDQIYYSERVINLHSDVAKVVLPDEEYTKLVGTLTAISVACQPTEVEGKCDLLLGIGIYLDEYLREKLGDVEWERMNKTVKRVMKAWFANPGTSAKVIRNHLFRSRKVWLEYLLTLQK